MRMAARTAALASVLAVLAGCSSSPPEPNLMILAAASLKSTFTDLSTAFTEANPAVHVESSFAGSADLLTQLTQGAPGDVFATADTPTMDRAAAAGLLAGAPTAFATNTLTIVVGPGNPKNVKGFGDLPGVSLVMCAVAVPCGAPLPRLQHEADVHLAPVSEESSVTDVLNKVSSGQADAGIVYVTDARSAGDKVSTVAFPEASSAVNVYQIAVLRDSRDSAQAHRFIDFVTGPAGQEALRKAGFGIP